MLDSGRSADIWRILFLLALIVLTTVSLAQQATESLPVVTGAYVPLYPPLARQAHIEGEVKLEVSTDYDHVASVSVVNGQPMLAQAARDNVKTWHFRPDIRMTFTVTFRYKLLAVSEKARCDTPDSNNRISLKLPKEVAVEADELWVCDPDTTVLKHK